MNRTFLQTVVVVLALYTLSMCSLLWAANVSVSNGSVSVVPRPVSVVLGQGSFSFSRRTVLTVHPASKRLEELSRLFSGQLDSLFRFRVVEHASGKHKPVQQIRLKMIPAIDSVATDGYVLTVGVRSIEIVAASDAGVFYGMQTLFQLVRKAGGPSPESFEIPALVIHDAPRFRWRGAHLDVARHFFPASFVKRFIDILALHKINVFHLHLTDDQGWRIEIKKYPRLTDIGAWRVDRGNLPWDLCDPQRPGEKPTYGGFYTQDEVREIVHYAAQRCITVIPEIEMPAHSQAALAAYPEYSCTGGPFTVPTGHIWPDTNIFCAGNDATFHFIEDVLTEVMELFPGPYIHIGGDEADKSAWKGCRKCQARISTETLRDVGELQSYFVKRVEKFLLSHGRHLIGWDEILEGGLAPEATVMSWRGMDGGIAAARAGHDVIMSPTHSCYFDYYQGEPEYEPLAIGGHLPIETVHQFEPAPDSLTPEQVKHIIGGQANLWTEFVSTPTHAEYMLLPRLAAIAEVVWSPKEAREWSDFARRLQPLLALYDRLHWHYARSMMRLEGKEVIDTVGHGTTVVLTSVMPGRTIRFTLDGSAVNHSSTLYTDPIPVDRTMTLRAGAFPEDQPGESGISRDYARDLANFCPVAYATPVSSDHPGSGQYTLTDMVRGGLGFEDGRWQGFVHQDVDVTVDLGAVHPVSRVSSGYLRDMANNILFPDSVLYAFSRDGVDFTTFPAVVNALPQDQLQVATQDFNFACPPTNARYIRVRAKNVGVCPAWHHAAGHDAWVFIDEIIAE